MTAETPPVCPACAARAAQPARTRVLFALSLTDAGLDALHEIVRAGGFRTPEAAMLHALARLGQHLDAGIPRTAFAPE